MDVILSRSYFGPNQHTGTSSAYLRIGFAPEESEASADQIEEAWRDVCGALAAGSSPEARAPGTAEEPSHCGVEHLETLLRATVEAIARFLGESPSIDVFRASPGSHQIELTVRGMEARVAQLSGELAASALTKLLGPQPEASGARHDFAVALEMLAEFALGRRPSLSEAALLAVAEERQIPVIRFNRWPFVVDSAEVQSVQRAPLQLGHGVHGQRLVGTGPVEGVARTEAALRNRQLAHAALRQANLPVPERDPEFTNLNSARRALRSAERLGYPVVLKPIAGPRGEGVSGALWNAEALDKAYEQASGYERHVIVERHIPGDTYQLLIMGREVVGACRQPALRAGESLEAAGAIDPAQLHDALRETALAAAACFDLQVAGVDVVTPDPTLPLDATGGAVIRLDPSPDLASHRRHGESVPFAAARRLLAFLCPPGRPMRIPVVAITGTAGKTTTSRMVARILEAAGHQVGLACTDGIYVGRERVQRGTYSGISGALAVLSDHRVGVAVLETSRGTLVRQGLGFDYANVAACIKVEADHIGLDGIDSVSSMARVKRVVVERATDLAVLNAEDPHCLDMLPYVTAKRTALASLNPNSPAIQSHTDNGGQAVVLDFAGNLPCICCREGSRQTVLMAVDEIPATWAGAARHNVQNALFATTIAMGLGIAPAAIRQGLASFHASPADSPKRINRYEKLPFQVVLDQAATAPGYRALSDFVDQLEVKGRRMLVFYGIGDRRDQDLIEIGQRISRSFDRFFCFEAATYRRGRQEGEVPLLLTGTLLHEGVHAQDVLVSSNKNDAIQSALRSANPDDLIAIVVPGPAEEVIGFLDQHLSRICEDRRAVT